jgi:hypothetical protein
MDFLRFYINDIVHNRRKLNEEDVFFLLKEYMGSEPTNNTVAITHEFVREVSESIKIYLKSFDIGELNTSKSISVFGGIVPFKWSNIEQYGKDVILNVYRKDLLKEEKKRYKKRYFEQLVAAQKKKKEADDAERERLAMEKELKDAEEQTSTENIEDNTQ